MEFEKYKIAHDLPEVPLMTWTNHDRPPADGGRGLRLTSVSILYPMCNETWFVFTGISACSELDQFKKTDGFNRAYGRATQKLVGYLRKGNVEPDFIINKPKTCSIQEIGRWIMQHAYETKLDFIKHVYDKRLELGLLKQPNHVVWDFDLRRYTVNG